MPQLILVVDDEPEIVELIGLNLIEAGYEVVTTATGREAFRAAATASGSPPQLSFSATRSAPR